MFTTTFLIALELEIFARIATGVVAVELGDVIVTCGAVPDHEKAVFPRPINPIIKTALEKDFRPMGFTFLNP